MDDLQPATSIAELILGALRQAGGEWLTRKQIAHKIGRSGGLLLPHDVRVLGSLVEAGSVVVERRSLGPVKREHIYCVEVQHGD